MIETSRRSLITGLVALVAAPAIVKASSLMQVKQSGAHGSAPQAARSQGRGGSGQVVQVTRTLPQQFRCIT